MKKKTLLLLLCLTLAFTMSACENTDDSAGNGNSTDNISNPDNVSGTDDAGNAGDSDIADNSPDTPAPIPTPIAPPDEYKLKVYEELAADYKIPVINVYTKGREEVLSREEYVDCVVDVFNCDEEFMMDEVAAGIRVRGNSTAHYGDVEKIRKEKAPYRIKFEEKQNMLGLNDGAECKSWVLLQTGWSLIPDDVAFRMAHVIFEDSIYISDSKFVHLYINEELQGIYLLCEQNQVNKNRVNIYEPEEGETDPYIGYYLEIDNYAGSEPDQQYFTMDYEGATVTDIEGTTRAFVPADYSIKNDIYGDEQKAFIELYMNNLFRALYEACENDLYLTVNQKGNLVKSSYTSSYEVANELLDLESVVNMYILYEIAHDNDCGEGSFYMCIDFSDESTHPKLTFTSPWDFNWAYTDEATGKYYAAAFNSEEFVKQMLDRSNPWFILLMTEDWFQDMVRERWTELRATGELDNVLLYEEQYVNTHDKEIHIKIDYAGGGAKSVLEWLRSRIEWLDTQWLLK